MGIISRYLKIGSIITVAAIIVGYGYFKSRNLIDGPVISIESPRNGEAATTSLVTIIGTAKNIAFISLNDRQIFVDEEGRIKEQLLLPYGYTILTLKARDKFGRETVKRLEFTYQ